MPKNIKAKKNGERNGSSPKKEMVWKDEEDENAIYGQVVSVLGGCRFIVSSFENPRVDRLCNLGKKAKKSGRVSIDSIVLFGKRDFQDTKGDIVYVYSTDQVNILKKNKCIPTNVKSSQNIETEDQEDFIVFGETEEVNFDEL